jgi:hypothetical protein
LAKTLGKHVQAKLHPWGIDVLDEIQNQGRTVVWVCERLKISKQTFYRWIHNGPPSPWVSKNIEQILNHPGFLRKWWRNEIKD